MIDNAAVSLRFGCASLTYDQHASVQREMAIELIERIRGIPLGKGKRILEIGCGTGYLTEKLLGMFPDATITALDISWEMVERAKKCVGKQVTFSIRDAEQMDWEKEGPFDLIVSNAAVQWFSQPDETFSHLIRGLSKGGWFIASTFGAKTFNELHTLFREVEEERGLPFEQHGLALQGRGEWEKRMVGAGFTDTQTIAQTYLANYEHARGFVRAIRGMGATHSESNHSLIAAGRLLSEVLRRYDLRYPSDDGVYATYEGLWMWGRR
ncbi:malonyl-CoA O-methyltransferase [Marininema mesophilum]|uniref:Malonyl-[acyl-carrier protein] O-methyltransferase n=1 Tax=Marininema mesophilum TaxID=1048340 RepID=A0A1H2W8A9_9BACL|nr:malonyl-ACP O-methyltransferase BioC [Marininema mesophilum]SDW76279.1 malonyl-CoA O-methyltransferase [Marininema mesophilum]